MSILRPVGVCNEQQSSSYHHSAWTKSSLLQNDWKAIQPRMSQSPFNSSNQYGSLVPPGQEPGLAPGSLEAIIMNSFQAALPVAAPPATSPMPHHSASVPIGQHPSSAGQAVGSAPVPSHTPSQATASLPCVPVPSHSQIDWQLNAGAQTPCDPRDIPSFKPSLSRESLEFMFDSRLSDDDDAMPARHGSADFGTAVQADGRPQNWMLSDPIAAAPASLSAAGTVPASSASDASASSSQADAAATPSRHLWLGNIPLKPCRAAMEECFQAFGPLDSVRVFPGKTYAFVNFQSAADAAMAKEALDGSSRPDITGSRPMIIRYQAETNAVAAAAKQEAKAGSSLGRDSPLLDPALMLKVCCTGLEMAEEVKGHPTKLSNRLNPNNIYFDPDLAERYKRLSKMEKEMLWAYDRSARQSLDLPSEAARHGHSAALPQRVIRAGGGRFSLDLPQRSSMSGTSPRPPTLMRPPSGQSTFATLSALWPASSPLDPPASQPAVSPPHGSALGPVGTRPAGPSSAGAPSALPSQPPLLRRNSEDVRLAEHSAWYTDLR